MKSENVPVPVGLPGPRSRDGCAVRHTGSPSVPRLEQVPLPGKAPGARTRKGETHSRPQASLLSRGNGPINSYFFFKS